QRMRPRLEPRRPALTLALTMAALIACGLLVPGRTARSWATLWHPAAAAPPVRLAVEPGSVKVTPGAALAVHARVWGTPRAPRIVRDHERAPAAVLETSGNDGSRVWRFDL